MVKDTQSATPVNLSHTLDKSAAALNSARLSNTKKFKSVSESSATGSFFKSNKLKTIMK